MRDTGSFGSRIQEDDAAEMLGQVVIHGDLSRLGPSDKVAYYAKVCESLGINPLTKPFEYIRLNGKEVLYATRSCAEQLRQRHRVSLEIVSRETIGDVYVVTARATLPSGRTDESTGAVSLDQLKGESLANAFMKAETKAKRRVTLSVCGLGILDETEVASLPPSVAARPTHGPSGRIAARIAGDDAPIESQDTLEIVGSIMGCQTMEQLTSVAEQLKGLGLTNGRREAALAAYRQRVRELADESNEAGKMDP